MGCSPCPKSSSFWRQDLFSLLSAHPLSAPTLLSMEQLLQLLARETSGRPLLGGYIQPGLLLPCGSISPELPTAEHAPLRSSLVPARLSFGENHLFIAILAAFSTFRQPTSLPP